MSRRGIRGGAEAGLLVAAVLLAAAGCSGSDTSPSDAVSKAASAASSVGSRAGDVVASATARAQEELDRVKGGVNAKGDIGLGTVAKDGDRSTVPVTATNSSGSQASYAVQVNFRDSGGNLLDTVVVTIDDVDKGKSKKATARSNRTLTGDVKADVGRALRH
ncbi:hypothetical protein ACIPWY_08770 [Streptomyces sp. NPDC090032]|uniref:hypothetical protein n=1 Tax=unclassified Streptomyces TaxID=2593676 RepID=UPI003713E994